MNERITFASMMVKHLDLPSITYFVRTGLFGYNVDVFIAISNVPPVIVIISISLNISSAFQPYQHGSIYPWRYSRKRRLRFMANNLYK